MASQKEDIQRLRMEYDQRATRLAGRGMYSHFNQTNLFFLQQRERQLTQLLKAIRFDNFSYKRILEIGCGGGGVLLNFLSYGAHSEQLFGIDLLHERLRSASAQLAGSKFTNADGQKLPFLPDEFDLLLQFTAFSSVLNFQVKQNMAAEMLRVLKPDGAILWYDFWWNPTNPQTAGIKPKEIKDLFPGCEFVFRKITLAPPIARSIVPISWPLAMVLESLQVFNSHYLAIIRKLKTEN